MWGGREGNIISVMELELIQSKNILGGPKLAHTSGSHMRPDIFSFAFFFGIIYGTTGPGWDFS